MGGLLKHAPKYLFSLVMTEILVKSTDKNQRKAFKKITFSSKIAEYFQSFS